jgi:SAM-dependent methyltransferase
VTSPRPPRWSALDLVEAYQLGHAVAALRELGLLEALVRPRTARALARLRRLDEAMLRGVLEFVAARTDLVRKIGDRFAAAAGDTAGARYLLDLYAGTFAGNAVALPRLLADPSRAARAVDRRRQARAFAAAAGSGAGAMPALLHQLGLDRVLDLGCGTAGMLIEAASRNPALVGWGLELHAPMRRLARQRIRAAGLGRRVRILTGDCLHLRAAVSAELRAAVRTLTMCQVANEMFGDGGRRFTRWLREARRLFPGRLLLVSDYYGRLGRGGRTPARREVLLHDYAQLISGQGVPPATAKEWGALYEAAGCRLLHVMEDRGTTRFVHFVRLDGGGAAIADR